MLDLGKESRPHNLTRFRVSWRLWEAALRMPGPTMACGDEHMNLNERNAAVRPIVMTTDFGSADPYAGVMKGVVLGIRRREVTDQ